jgi:hypothetical protein
LCISRPIVYNSCQKWHFGRITHDVLRKIPSIDFAKLTEEALLTADPDIDVAQPSPTSTTSTVPVPLIRLRAKIPTSLSKLRRGVSGWNMQFSLTLLAPGGWNGYAPYRP